MIVLDGILKCPDFGIITSDAAKQATVLNSFPAHYLHHDDAFTLETFT